MHSRTILLNDSSNGPVETEIKPYVEDWEMLNMVS